MFDLHPNDETSLYKTCIFHVDGSTTARIRLTNMSDQPWQYHLFFPIRSSAQQKHSFKKNETWTYLVNNHICIHVYIYIYITYLCWCNDVFFDSLQALPGEPRWPRWLRNPGRNFPEGLKFEIYKQASEQWTIDPFFWRFWKYATYIGIKCFKHREGSLIDQPGHHGFWYR